MAVELKPFSLQIFDTKRKLKTIDVPSLEKHGKIIDNDGETTLSL